MDHARTVIPLALLIAAVAGGGVLLLGRADDRPSAGPAVATSSAPTPSAPADGPGSTPTGAPGAVAPESLRGATDRSRPSGRTPAGEVLDELDWACDRRAVGATGYVDDSALPVLDGPEAVVADVTVDGQREVAFRSEVEVLYVWLEDDAVVRAEIAAAIGGTWASAEQAECADG